MSRHSSSSSRPSGRSSGSSAGGGGLAGMPARTKVLLGGLVLIVLVFAGYKAIGMLGGPGPALAATAEETSDLAALRAMSVDDLARERKKRTDALNALMNTPNAPSERLQAA